MRQGSGFLCIAGVKHSRAICGDEGSKRFLVLEYPVACQLANECWLARVVQARRIMSGGARKPADEASCAARPRNVRKHHVKGNLLVHHPHLLRQRGPAPRHRVHHHRRRHRGALPAHERLRRGVRDGHGRARPEGGRHRCRQGYDPAGLVRFHGARIPRRMGYAGHHLHRLRAHHRAAPRRYRAEVLAGPLRQGLVLQGQLRRLVLRARGNLLRRERPREERRGRIGVPRLQAPRAEGGRRGELVLQAVRVRRQAAGVLRGEPRLHPSRDAQERDRVVREERSEGSVHLAQHVRLGRAAAVRRGSRGLRVGRRAAGLPHRHRLRRRGRARRRVRRPLAHAVPLRGQRHHAFSLRHLARHADGGRAAHHAHGVRPRLPAHQGREDVEVEGQRAWTRTATTS